MCEGAADVLDALQRQPSLREPQGDLFNAQTTDEQVLEREAARLRERAYALVSHTATPVDEIVRALAEPAPAVFAALVELAVAGRVELLSGGLVARS
jgi:DNA processing protein